MGIVATGTQVSGGLDGAGNDLASSQLGSSQTYGGTTFAIAPTGANNVVQAVGQTIGLPNVSLSQLQILATSVNGNQLAEQFVVHYTDGSSQTFFENMSDWASPQGYTDESLAVTMAFRATGKGGISSQPFYAYEYSLPINSTKTVQSITLPNDSHVDVLAMSSVAPVSTPALGSERHAVGKQHQSQLDRLVRNHHRLRRVPRHNRRRRIAHAPQQHAPAGRHDHVPGHDRGAGQHLLLRRQSDQRARLRTHRPTNFRSRPPPAAPKPKSTWPAPYNQVGITSDGTHISGGIDGSGNTLSANLLASSVTTGGVTFNIGAAGANNVVVATGQTIGLPNGNYSSVQFLAVGVNGNQPSQTFTVNYSDGSSHTFTQSISDWASPQGYSGESVAAAMGYRNTAGGGHDNRSINVYSYSLPVDDTKTIVSITLPSDYNVKLLAITAVQ